MHPSPAAEWLRDYCLKLTGSHPTAPLEAYLLQHPADLPQQRRNPVARPPAVEFPSWFNAAHTAQGQLLASQLGPNSGFFQEYLNWAPSVSWLFDLVAGLVQLTAHPSTPAPFRDALFPFVYGFGAVLEQTITLIKIHEVHGQHAGTPLDGTWRALQTQIRLQGTSSTYSGEVVADTLDRIHKDLLTQQLKAVAKNEASRTNAAGRRGQDARQDKRDPRRDSRRDRNPPPRPTALSWGANPHVSLSTGRGRA